MALHRFAFNFILTCDISDIEQGSAREVHGFKEA
jgi:hypothetical protein